MCGCSSLTQVVMEKEEQQRKKKEEQKNILRGQGKNNLEIWMDMLMQRMKIER
ncbi:hypothetical protein [Bacillus sp. 1P06AnD]|uniref:hypothetical protein n=1 Tax=Bacillus sp. 1P06AnD TaxID=3132208 RepID=UPI0039A00AC4